MKLGRYPVISVNMRVEKRDDECACQSNLRKGISIWSSVMFVVVVLLVTCLSCTSAKKDDHLDCPGDNENPAITATKSSALDKKASLLNAAFASSESMEVEPASNVDETWDSFRPMFIFCKASYPITWEFSGNKPPDLSEETHVYVDSVLNTTKRCFVSSLKLLASGYTGKESRTGNYTCKSFDGKKSSSIYRFAHGECTEFFGAT